MLGQFGLRLVEIEDRSRLIGGQQAVRLPVIELTNEPRTLFVGDATLGHASDSCHLTVAVTWDGRLIFHLSNPASRPQVHGLVLASGPHRTRTQHRGTRTRNRLRYCSWFPVQRRR